MDTSKQYIKMCDYPKIQDSRLKGGLVHGDYYHARAKHPSSVDIFIDPKRLWSGEIVNAFIWLPRQDQLQEMIDGGFTHQALQRFYQWYYSGINPRTTSMEQLRTTSMEQLWLAFVMKEKFNKTWNGETWS